MMSAIEFTSTFDARCTNLALALRAYGAAGFAKLRAIAPYALMEVVLPGGSVMALLLWLYRRPRKNCAFPTDETCFSITLRQSQSGGALSTRTG
jgi:hypothetical protein